jgi:hypothetical protein
MNTSETIEISYKWDEENFEKAFANAYDYQYRHSARRYVGWFFIALLQFGIVAALKAGEIGLLLFSTFLIIYWYGIKRWLVYRRARASFMKSPLKDQQIRLSVTEKAINQEQVSVPWEEIEGVVPEGDAIILYERDKAYYIPDTAFGTIEEKSRFKALAKKRGKLYV